MLIKSRSDSIAARENTVHVCNAYVQYMIKFKHCKFQVRIFESESDKYQAARRFSTSIVQKPYRCDPFYLLQLVFRACVLLTAAETL